MSVSRSSYYGVLAALRLLFDDYKESTTAFATNTFATVPWILFGLFNRPLFAVAAISLHLAPPGIYYYLYSPFGIEIDYTPTTKSEDGREPDKTSERKDEAILDAGEGSIFVTVSISGRLDDFQIQFSTPSEVTIELRDVPREEQNYDREDNVLEGYDINQYEFSLVLEVFVEEPTNRRREYPLKFKEYTGGKTIKNVTLIEN